MKNLFSALSTYGFATRPYGMYWGYGCLMWGTEVAIAATGDDLYKVETHRWYYNEWGERVYDTHSTATVHGGQVWALLPEHVLRGRRYAA